MRLPRSGIARVASMPAETRCPLDPFAIMFAAWLSLLLWSPQIWSQDKATGAAPGDAKPKRETKKKSPVMSREEAGKLAGRLEVNYIAKICNPTPEQLQRLVDLADTYRQRADQEADDRSKEIDRKYDDSNSQPSKGYAQDHDYQRVIRKGLAQSVKGILSAEQLAQFQSDFDSREAFRNQLTVAETVMTIEHALVLSSEQRDKLEAILAAAGRSSTIQERESLAPDLIPKASEQLFIALLNDNQRSVWQERPKARSNYAEASENFHDFRQKAIWSKDADGQRLIRKPYVVSLPDDIFDGLTFGQDKDAAAARRRLNRLLELELGEVDRACRLTDTQKSALQSAMAKELNRRFDHIEERRTAYRSVRSDELYHIYADRLSSYSERLFGDGMFFAKLLDKILTPMQKVEYERIAAARREYSFRTKLKQVVSHADDFLSLRATQHEAFFKLLTDSITFPQEFRRNESDHMRLERQISKIPRETLAAILDEPQQARLEYQLSIKKGAVNVTALYLGADLDDGPSPEVNTPSPQDRPSERKTPGEVPASVKPVLTWMPVDTETVIAAQAFSLRAFSLEDFQKGDDFKIQMQQMPLLDLASLEDGKYLKPLAGRQVALALRGGRNYQFVTKFGGHRSEGCAVIRFTVELGKARTQWIELLKTGAREVRKMEGHDVFVFPTTTPMANLYKPEVWQGTYVVALSADTVLCATSDRYLQELLKRIAVTPADRTLPDNLPIWKQVDPAAPAWMVRQIPISQQGRLIDATGYHLTNDWFQAIYLPISDAADEVKKEVQHRWSPAASKTNPEVETSPSGAVIFSRPASTIAPIGPLGTHWWVYVLQAENGNVGVQ